MCILDVRIAPANMGHYDAILAPEFVEKLMRSVRVRRFVRDVNRVRDLGMRRAMDRFAFMPVVHVTVAADCGVGGPFVTGNANQSARSWATKAMISRSRGRSGRS